MLARITLEKRMWRNDWFWTLSLMSFRLVKKIPFFFDEKALARSQYWTRPQLVALQHQRMRSLLRDAQRYSFWRSVLSAAGVSKSGDFSPGAFERIPIMTKSVYRNLPEESYTSGALGNSWSRDFTSGSTGRPFSFYIDRRYELSLFAFCDRMFRVATGGKRLRLVSLRARERAGVSLQKGGYMFFVRGYGSIRHRLPQLEEHLRAYPQGVIMLVAFASSLVELARACLEKKIQLPIRGVVAGGEAVSRSHRDIVREAFGVEVFLGYSARELGWIGFECEKHRTHINEEWGYVEIVDASGSPLPAGQEGRVVITTFDNRTMPFIRYDTGDRGRIEPDQCECGRTLRVIHVLGRQIEHLTFEDGRTTSLSAFSLVFDRFPQAVEQFQIVQTSMYAFLVRVVPGPVFQSYRAGLARQLGDAIHPNATIAWEEVDNIPEGPNGKAVYFISLERAKKQT